jgi:hypothetical protein
MMDPVQIGINEYSKVHNIALRTAYRKIQNGIVYEGDKIHKVGKHYYVLCIHTNASTPSYPETVEPKKHFISRSRDEMKTRRSSVSRFSLRLRGILKSKEPKKSIRELLNELEGEMRSLDYCLGKTQ